MSNPDNRFRHALSYHAPATPPANWYVPRAVAVVSVRRDGWVYLNSEAGRETPTGDGTADLRPPARFRDCWHLDCRPAGPSRCAPVGDTAGRRFRAPARAAALFAGLPLEVTHLRFGLRPVTTALFALIPLV